MAMTHKQRMLGAMRGEAVDRIPWAPRMDLWLIAQRARDTVPPRFRGMNTAEIADELNVGCHAVRADYTLVREPIDHALRGLGVDNHPDYPFRVELDGLTMKFEQADGVYSTLIETPAGDVTMRLRRTPQMAADGISLPYVEKYPICSPDDYEPVSQVFEHLKVTPTSQAYASFQQRIGGRGVAVASGAVACCPMHLLLHDLMAMENFFVAYMDDRAALERFAARLDPFYDAMLDASLQSNAEVIFWGGNYDQDTTWPPFFKDHVIPQLQRVSAKTHAAGKLLLTHTDGEYRNLLGLLSHCGFDVAESVCPAPMTSCTLSEIRDAVASHAAVWGGIPSIVLIDASVSDDAFMRYMDDLFANLGDGRRLILGVSDNVPPDVNFDRLDAVAEWVERFGAVL